MSKFILEFRSVSKELLNDKLIAINKATATMKELIIVFCTMLAGRHFSSYCKKK